MEAFTDKYLKYAKILDMYKNANGEEPAWDNITRASLSAFVDYLCDNLAKSSAKTYAAMFKSVLNTYSDQTDLPSGWQKILSIKNDISEQVYLTETEISEIMEYAPQSEVEAIVQQQFIMGALTGARHSDYVRFTPDNVNGDFLCYVSQKTHIKASVPLSPAVAAILGIKVENRRMSKTGVFERSGAYRKSVSDPTFNTTLRRIARACGICQPMKLYRRGEFVTLEKWEALSSHSARRTFATNIYLRCHDLYLVSKLCGHTDTKMTEKYICVNLEAMTDEVMQYFTRFA